MIWNIKGLSEHLTQDGDGYVCWRGVQVEHYSFPHDEDGQKREEEAARELVRRCEHLEALGVPVSTGSAIWSWSWFADLTAAAFAALPSLAREIFMRHGDIHENAAGQICWLHDRPPEPESYPYHVNLEFMVLDHGYLFPMAIYSDDFGGYYHTLTKAGWNTAQMGQAKGNGCCYATTDQVINYLKLKGVIA